MSHIKLRDLLAEAEEEAKAPEGGAEKGGDDAAAKLRRAFQDTSVSGFVAKFKAIASDPKVQAILKAGTTDKGGEEDEKVTYQTATLPVKSLKPTQNEIGFDQSIKNILTDQYGSLKSILSGNANVGGPIVTYNSQYVIDGHHRWSQVYAGNPNAKMEALDIKGELKPTEVLKIVHAAIAAKVGELPSANPKGINILDGVTEQQVLEAVNTNLSEKAKKLWAENGQKSNEEVAKYITGNLQALIKSNKPVPGAPGRKDMPQADVGGAPEEKLALLAKGMVNFKDPVAADVKKESIQEQRQRFKKIAGINKK